MKPSELLTSDEITELKQLKKASSNMKNVLEKMVDNNIPYNEHYQKAVEQLNWFESIERAFELSLS